MTPTEIEALRRAVEGLHAPAKATFVRADDVHEAHDGEPVWSGTVATFAITGRVDATLAYAWSEPTDAGRARYFAVLRAAHIASPADAVRASIAMDAKAVETAKKKLS
jgi:hypothetical protein